jgi:hypothetical protein
VDDEIVQGGSNMTGTNCDWFTHSQSRSYLNHLVSGAKKESTAEKTVRIQKLTSVSQGPNRLTQVATLLTCMRDVPCSSLGRDITILTEDFRGSILSLQLKAG